MIKVEKNTKLNIPNLTSMGEMEMRQMYHENEAWKRLLNFMLDENVLLKYRLSEIVRYISDPQFLEKAEDFQSRFVKKDILISLLRDDVAEIGSLLISKEPDHSDRIVQIHSRLKKLRNNVAEIEKQFSKLKLDFNRYMSERIVHQTE